MPVAEKQTVVAGKYVYDDALDMAGKYYLITI